MRYLILVTSGEKLEVKADRVRSEGQDLFLADKENILAVFPRNNVVYIISMDHVTTVSE